MRFHFRSLNCHALSFDLIKNLLNYADLQPSVLQAEMEMNGKMNSFI